MKHIILFLLFFSFTETNYAQSLVKSESENQKQINILNGKIDSLSNQLSQSQNPNLEEQIIKEYNNIFSLFSIGFTVLLGLFGLVFPIMIYFIQIKPTQESIRETKSLLNKLENNFEQSFREHFKKNRVKMVDEAISNYESQNTAFISSSYSTIDSYKNEGFTELQIVRIIKILKSQSEDKDKDFLARMLLFQEDINSEYYFQDLIRNNPKDNKCIWGALYFATYDKSENIDLIADIVINGYSLVGMLSSLFDTSKKFCIELLNNEHLVNNLNESKINQFLELGTKYFIEKFDQETIESTLIWKRNKIKLNKS